MIHATTLGSSVGKESACSAGDLGSIPGLGRSPGGGNGNPLQYPCLDNLVDRGAWWVAVHGVAESGTTEWLTIYVYQENTLSKISQTQKDKYYMIVLYKIPKIDKS